MYNHNIDEINAAIWLGDLVVIPPGVTFFIHGTLEYHTTRPFYGLVFRYYNPKDIRIVKIGSWGVPPFERWERG